MTIYSPIPPPLQEPQLQNLSTLSWRVFQAAKNGKPITLGALLYDKSPAIINLVLSESVECDDYRCTALVAAARNGHNTVVKLLLDQYGVNTEQTGTVKFNGYVIEGATALWSAAGAGYFEVVKTLVDHSADVNHATVSDSTPLRAACYDGRLDVVKCLVQNKADIHKPNKYGNTCVMIAGYKGHGAVVEYLLVNGGDVNAQANCGATAMHFTAECGRLAIVKLLVRHHAKMLKNEHGLTPLMVACDNGMAEVAEFLMSLPKVTTMEKIQALELLGASFANDKEHYDIAKTYHYFYLAMLHRCMESEKVNIKEVCELSPAYADRRECVTLQELKEIKGDHFALQMEALIIRERILGQQNPDLLHPIIFRGAVCADSMQFSSCISLWMHAMNIRHRLNRSIQKDILRFAQVFSQMLHIGEEVPFQNLYHVLALAVVEIESWQAKLKSAQDQVDRKSLQSVLDADILTTLYILMVMINKHVNKTKTQEHQSKKLVYRLISLNPRTANGSTPLHMAVNQLTPVDDFHTNNVCYFPSYRLVELLLECGADPNATDHFGETPLHVVVQYNKPISDFTTLHSIIVLLASRGCHLDQTNDEGKTASDVSTTGVAEIILIALIKPSLKCIAARTVKRHGIKYKGLVPKTLEGFIEMH
ncbi:protein fem-1 homolog B-like [Acanthaster planci]|uniref:Protein fem-1 homolog B-like n=1 Tax=Acanthaster planci TaxID=133434 RepID=A0A8B7ZIL5_ACAPL|nr:protein fem-1 homolog B-like [Acanthaster planci]